MSEVKDSLSDLEKHRLQLEENLAKLQKSLQHWQTWDAEYEALKEEVDAIPEANEKELTRIQNDFEGELVNHREVGEIFGAKGSKSKSQINNILDRRIDYVTKNIETLIKQVEAAENKYAAATVISQPDAKDEEGQPITEIIERLDEDGNVVSYQLNRPGDSIPAIEETLEKAGVKDLVEEVPKPQEPTPKQPITPKPITRPVQERSATPVSEKKGVSFAPDTKEVDGPSQPSRNANRVVHIMKSAEDQEKFAQEEPVIPDDESEEDAELRRQMLEYGMGEMSAVVAELEIDEGGSEDEDYEFEYSDEGFDETDDEDKYGRYTGSVITPDYQQRMLELEKKLGIRSRFTQEAEPHKDGDEDSGSDDERIGRIVVNKSQQVPASNPKPTASPSPPPPLKSNIREKQTKDSGSKGVRFAQNLDVAPEDQPAPGPVPAMAPTVEEKESFVEPLSDVVERSGPTKKVEAKSTRKPSRFKKTVGDTGIPKGPFDLPAKFLDHGKLPTPTGPDGTTIADALVERDTPVKPRGFDEFDDDMINDAVADEYHRMRKKFIHRDGGFLKEDENPIQPLDEADGGLEPMSRFRSARLSKQ